MKLVASIVFVSTLVVAAACGSGGKHVGDACAENSECASGTCGGGPTCTPRCVCNTDSDCSSGSRCVTGGACGASCSLPLGP